MTAHDRYLELVYGHALSSLEPEDEQALVAHLPACAECSRALVEARETAGQLAYAVDTAELPPGLFASIRESVLAESPDAFELTPAAPVERQAVAKVVSIESARRRRLETRASKIVAVAASVSVAAIVGLGAWNVSLQRDSSKQGHYSQAIGAALAVMKAETGQTVALKAADGSVTAVAVMHTNGSMDLVTDGLAPNAKNSRYVLWGQSGIEPAVPLGDFDVDQARVDTVPAVASSSIASERPQRLLISKESGTAGKTPLPGENVAPTGPIYAQGETT